MEEERLTQKKVILDHLKRFGSITPLEALREYGCYRLGARIGDLRSEGVRIKTDMEESVSRITGRPVHFAKYVLDNGTVQPS